MAELVGNVEISDLNITGQIKSNWHTGGIIGEVSPTGDGKVINCVNKVNVIGYNMVGGIVGGNGINIENCKNYGNIVLLGTSYDYGGAGGICGTDPGSGKEIRNCENYGKISGLNKLGGICGTSNANAIVINCKSFGDIEGKRRIGGILGWKRNGNIYIINCYNDGKITGDNAVGGTIGEISGADWDCTINVYIQNCYNIGEIRSDGIVGGIVGTQDTIVNQNYLYINNYYSNGNIKGKEYGNIIGHIYNSARTDTKTEVNNVYYSLKPSIGIGTLTSGEAILKSESEIKSQTFVDLLNSNIGTNTEWKKWKLGSNGYPTFLD